MNNQLSWTKHHFGPFRFLVVFILTVLVINLVSGNSLTLNAKTDVEKKQIENELLQKKGKLNSNLSTINTQLDDLKNSIGEATSQKRTYLEQKKSVEQEITTGEQLILQTKLAISQLDEELALKEKDIQERNLRVVTVVQQMQQQGESSTFEVFFSGQDFGDIISNWNNIGTLESRLVDSVQALNQAKLEQQTLKTQFEKTKKDQEDTQVLLQVKKQDLDELVKKYDNNVTQFEKDLVEQENQAKTTQAEISKAEQDAQSKYKALIQKRQEEASRRAAEEAQSKATSVTPRQSAGKPNSGPSNRSYGACQSKTVPVVFPIKFGEMIAPTSGVYMRGYGTSTMKGDYPCHNGIDIANSGGTKLVAVANGVIKSKGFNSGGYGNFVTVEHTYPGKGSIVALYGHMQSQSPLSIGTRVNQGEVVGYMGTTGHSTGNHLHFTLIDGESYGVSSSPYGLFYDPQDYISF